MQPEDIIRQKEWGQLSETEKQIVFPLTESESEYNLLKNMLKIAAREPGNVPGINPAVHRQLQNQFKKKEQKKSSIWYYAAASVMIAAITLTWLLMKNRKDDHNEIVVAPKIENPKQQIDTASKKPGTNLSLTSVQKKIILPSKKTIIKRSESQPALLATINTSIANDEKMLALITEVY